MPTITGGHHVAFTVRNADQSAQWHGDLSGMHVVLNDDDEAVQFRLLAHPDSGWVVGVRQEPGREEGAFDEFRAELDYSAFGLSSRAELESREQRLRAAGVRFAPIAKTPIGSVILFRDRDNTQLEFWLPVAQ
jgi:catechol 2,3-dioxygenase-like lactoylglutathione lyase family enzyme